LARIVRLAALFTLQVVLVLLLCEGALRVFRPRIPSLNTLLYLPTLRTDFDGIADLPTLMRGTVRGHRPFEREGDFVFNSRSMRTAEYAGEKRPGVYRIAVLGDSFAEGSGGTPYRDMWTTRLERELNERATRAVEVFSLGVGGAGPSFELRLWELERELLRADLVVLGFFVGNDFTDGFGQTPWEESAARRLSLVFRLLGNSYRLWRERDTIGEGLLLARESPAGERGGFVANEQYVKRREARHSEQGYLEIEAERIQICLRSMRPWFDRRSSEVLQVLSRFRDQVHAAGSEFVVVIIPDEFQVDPELRARVLRHLGLGPAALDPEHPQRRLAALLDQHQIAYLDLLPAFRERAATERLYWLRNTHWNVAGNALAAEVLARHLAAEVAALGAR
jgi:hypothetical protein